MRRPILATLASVAMLVMVAVSGGPASAATRTQFTATLTKTVVDPGKVWVSGATLHVRAQIDSGTVTGDLQGTESDATDLDLSLVNGSGADHGTFTLSSTEVIWSGTFAGPVSADLASGDFTALGDDGSLMQGRFTQIGEESFALQGTILDPMARTERPGEARR